MNQPLVSLAREILRCQANTSVREAARIMTSPIAKLPEKALIYDMQQNMLGFMISEIESAEELSQITRVDIKMALLMIISFIRLYAIRESLPSNNSNDLSPNLIFAYLLNW